MHKKHCNYQKILIKQSCNRDRFRLTFETMNIVIPMRYRAHEKVDKIHTRQPRMPYQFYSTNFAEDITKRHEISHCRGVDSPRHV